MDNDEMMVWKMDTTKTWENACKINRPVPLLAIPGSFDVHCKSGERSTEGEKNQQRTRMQTLARHTSVEWLQSNRTKKTK